MKRLNLKSLMWRRGLLPAIVQNSQTGRVLMLGHMSPESLRRTLKSGLVTFYSRSRHKLWRKGETSGNFLALRSLRADCDKDALLIEAAPAGPTCHTGSLSCFDTHLVGSRESSNRIDFLDRLEGIISQRFQKRVRGSYIASLLAGNPDRLIQKVGEEAVETVLAAKRQGRGKLEEEAADLLFHLMVLLQSKKSTLGRVAEVLKRRHDQRHRTRRSQKN